MKHYQYLEHELILAKDNYQNYLIIRDRNGICVIIATDLSEEDIDEIKWEFESNCLTDEEFCDGLPFTDLSSYNEWKVIA